MYESYGSVFLSMWVFMQFFAAFPLLNKLCEVCIIKIFVSTE